VGIFRGLSIEQGDVALGRSAVTIFGVSFVQVVPRGFSSLVVKRILLVIFVMSCMALVVVGVLLWRDMTRAFPEIAPGKYVGMIRPHERGEALVLYVQRDADAPMVAVALGSPGTSAQKVPIKDPLGGTRLPLIITGQDLRLRLTGDRRDERRYEGEYFDPIRDRHGKWYLDRIDSDSDIDREDGDLREWIGMVKELHNIEAAIELVKRKYDAQKNKIDKLSRYVVDEGALKQTASSRLSDTSSALDSLKTDVEKLQVDLDTTMRNADLSQRISPKGRLVILSRESLQRESRWIEITLKLLAPETAPGFEEQLERARRVKAIQDQIEAEYRRIEELEGMNRNYRSGNEIESEEEFYRGLQ